MVALSLEGNTILEIRVEIGRDERTVRRTLAHFRNKLEKAMVDPSRVFDNASC